MTTPALQRNYASLAAARRAAKGCRACPLWRPATQTVFGEGNDDARIMLVGEQPGDKEDIEGHPFVGPAGQLLRRALGDAGIAPETAYITNAVKHFKFIQRGKRRMHQKPAAPEIAACVPWLQHELAFVAPSIVVLLGVTAMKAVLGKVGTITTLRGRIMPFGERVALITVHPSSLLRAPDDESRRKGYAAFVKDLGVAAAYHAKPRARSA